MIQDAKSITDALARMSIVEMEQMEVDLQVDRSKISWVLIHFVA